jgi:hypothetical protein
VNNTADLVILSPGFYLANYHVPIINTSGATAIFFTQLTLNASVVTNSIDQESLDDTLLGGFNRSTIFEVTVPNSILNVESASTTNSSYQIGNGGGGLTIQRLL